MPQFNSYPAITDPQPGDVILIYQDSSGAVKTVTVDNFADAVGDILGTTSGAPLTGKYILQTPHVDLSSAQSLSELATGILKSTTATGVVSIAASGSDYVAPGVITSSGLTSITGVVLGRTTAGTGAIEAITTLPQAVQDNITRLGTIVAGEWNGDPIDLGVYGTGNLDIDRFDNGDNASSTSFWRGDGVWATIAAGGDVTSNTATSVDNELVLFSGTGGKTIKRASSTGIASLTSGVLSTIVGPTGAIVGTTDTQTLSDKTLASPIITGAVSFPDGVRQTFNPDATTPGFNVGSIANDPSTPANGDIWYDSTGNLLRARINGATVSLGAAGGGGTVTNTGALTVNQVVVGNAGTDVKILAASTNGFVLTLVAGIPAWSAASTGDVVGPAGATDNAIARFDTGTGKLLQNSGVTISDSGAITLGTASAGAYGGAINVYGIDDDTTYINTHRASADAFAPTFVGAKSRGSLASPTATQSGDGLFSLSAGGYGTSWYEFAALFSVHASETWSGSARGTEFRWSVTAATTTTRTTKLVLTNAGFLIVNGSTDDAVNALQVTGSAIVSTSITTGAPGGGTAAAWRFGVAASVSPTSPNRTIELQVGATTYYLHAKTTND